MSNEKYRYSYESPNIVIVPTVSFIDGPPAKKIKLDDVSEKTRTINNINKTFKSNSWASNYLHSIGQPQLATSPKPKLPYICQPDRKTNLEDEKNPLPENGEPSENKTSSVMHTPNISKTTLKVLGTKENVNILQQNPPKSTSPISWFFGSLQTNSDIKTCTDIGDNNRHTSVAQKQINEKGTKENTSILQQNPPKATSPISWFFGSNNKKSAFMKCTSDIGDNNKHTSVTQKQINEKNTKENISLLPQKLPKPTSPISWFFGSNLTNSAFTKCTSDIGDKHTSVAHKQMNEKDNHKFNLKTPKSQLRIAKDPVVLSSETRNDKIERNLIQKQNKAHDNYCLKSKVHDENDNKYKYKNDSEKDINRRHDIYKQKLRNEVYTNKFKINTFYDDRTKQGIKVAKKTLIKNGSCSGIKNPNIQEIDNRVKSLLSSVLPVQTNKKLAAVQVNLLKKQSKSKATKNNNKVRNVECVTDSRIISSAENSKCEDKHETHLVNTHENRKGKISRKPTHLDVNTLKKNRLIKSSHVNQTKDKNKREKQYVQSAIIGISESKVKSNAPRGKVPFKHKRLHKDSNKGCDIKEDVKTEQVIKVMNAVHENDSGKILLKKSNLKSVVQLTDNFEFEVPSQTYAEAPLMVEDLRKKLDRGKKYRDNLIVSVPNDVTFEQENKIKELPKQKSNEKVTTIKLVINLISGTGKTKNKSIEEEPRSNETNERELASIDLSFLDDFNVDDIVDSLNYDVNTSNIFKEDNKKLINTGIETTCEAPDTNHLNQLKNNKPYLDIKLGTTSENKTAQDGINDEVHVHKVKREETLSVREIVIETELIPIDEASITEKAITPNKPMSCDTSREIAISENKESLSSVTNITNQKTVTVRNSIASNLNEPNTVAIKKETENSDTEHPAERNNVFNFAKESRTNLESDTIQDLTKPKQETGIDMQHMHTNINQSNAYNLVKSCTASIVTSKNSENTSTSIIDLTEPDQNVRQVNNDIINKKNADYMSVACSYIDLTEPEFHISPKEHPSDTDITCSVDTSTKPANYIIDTSETCDDILIIDLTESEKNIEPITQQLVTDLNNIISENMEISETNCLPINVAEIENESGSKIQNSCKDKVDPECNSIITEQHKAIRTSSLKAAMQVSDSNESNKNILAASKNEPKATDATSTSTGVKSQDNSSIVNHSSQVIKESTEFRQGFSVIMPLGLRKTSFDELLSESLKERMLNYLHINYDIGMLIRRGKYSRIFHCTDQKKNEYAIKLLHSKQDQCKLGVKKEKMILDMQKDIPKENQYFVHLISGFGMQGRWCFLMEYYPTNLRQVLKDRKECFHINDVQRLSRQLVSAVIILRHNNIIHSDIKPEHILLNSSLDTLKLCGFDECRKVDDVILLPNIGTASYRAPEIILGYSDGFSIDVWSTALVMFEMAAAYRLFSGVYNNDILYKQMSILGPIPFEVVLSSIFKDHHFLGNETQIIFKRRVGINGKDIVQIRHFERVGIASHIYKVHQKFFKNTSSKDKANGKEKLRLFCDLLHEMLVMDPQKRLPIEFVYANPFLYEYCVGNLF